MDNLKFYARNADEIQSLFATVNIFSANIGMTFCTSKCAHLSLKRGKYNASEGINLPNGELIKSLEATDGYKYLGSDVLHTEMKEKISREYHRRLRLILESQLNSRNRISAINAYCLPVVRYAAGIVKWNLNDLRATDRKTRTL